MEEALRFIITLLDKNQSEEFLGLCYAMGMIGCEEDEKEGELSYTCYFDDENAATSAISMADTFIKSYSKIERVANQDWNAKWRETIEPIKITDSIWVSPEWLQPPLEDGEHWIKIEPRMAFGTGHHETTRLASQEIIKTAEKRNSLLDIGTGSGILAFVAEIAGYNKIVGVEIDPDCEINLKENYEANVKKADITLKIGAVEELPLSEKFDTIIINIIRTHSEPLIQPAVDRMAIDGQLIWSGILVEERDLVVNFAEKRGLKLLEERNEEEWWVGRFTLA